MRNALIALVAAGAAATLAGVAIAQIGDGRDLAVLPRAAFGPPPVEPLGSHWTSPELWDGYDDPNRPLGPSEPPLAGPLQTKMTQQVADGLKVAVPQMREACAVDR